MNIQSFSAKTLALAGVLGLGFVAPALADNHTMMEMEAEEAVEEMLPTASIVDIVSSVDEFSTLGAALEAAELTEALMGDGPFTVFAPPNEAFDALPDGILDVLLMPENQDILTDILTYHVVPGAVMSSDLETGLVETLEGTELPVVIEDDMVTVGDIPVVAVDIPATNGVIHVIDGVLAPAATVAELEAILAEMAEEEVVEEEVIIEEEVVVEEEVIVEEETVEPVPGLW
ncbi:fasciclin domain-containing protein [Leptolyngbya iicbica]|uniref:Fasciclin domain-containing protein n=2 Tax=Cyanophyceae TaxID=3028117 RepID=A0A4Q7EHM8_9CYAN|nr:fasciclin domain-containing protein [Leptolyngbya sp. LK]RZM82627.1 fasciclin domain-containing protein [Leptolyngbya sp. LK]